ncbi:metallophosphoesterase [Luteibacter sp. CQ10]|uniref:metallophosphoesterase n=1 Tax=Luteibacter sp. CQ10 TaxID=2805821 RepID=UPI0034A1F12B
MRVFALSDIHVDYEVNARWVQRLSHLDYRDDLLILAGDVTDRLDLLAWCVAEFAKRFRRVLFVPGNHDLWVIRDAPGKTSWEKFDDVAACVNDAGASMRPFRHGGLHVVPLLSWYDYSFGEPDENLRSTWMDFAACRWPEGTDVDEVSERLAAMNPSEPPTGAERVVTFSHFMPRIDLMPASAPASVRMLFPVFGSTRLDAQLRRLGADTHVYGHSHLNRTKRIDGVTYVNNAFGYPYEEHIAAKRLVPIVTE